MKVFCNNIFKYYYRIIDSNLFYVGWFNLFLEFLVLRLWYILRILFWHSVYSDLEVFVYIKSRATNVPEQVLIFL